MLKAIRIKLFQQTANYRKPASFLVRESYPLPPYSTVIGMIHKACDFKTYHDMELSIQGRNASETSDLARMYNFGGVKYDNTRHQAKVKRENSDDFDGINIGPKNIHLLTDVELLIHIVPKDESDIETIVSGLNNPSAFLNLGRHEDIVRIDEVAVTELSECDDENIDYSGAFDIYVPVDKIGDNEVRGTVYNLNKKFAPITEKTKTRQWEEVVKAMHICSGVAIDSEQLLFDKEMKTIVALA